MKNLKAEIAEILLHLGAITLRPDNPFVWASQIRSPIYCDNRLLMSDVSARRTIREAFCQVIKDGTMQPGLIAGVATSAIPFAAWVAERLQKPFVYVRKEAKAHGRERKVEGKVVPGVEAIVIEDLVSTGESSCAAVEALREAGAKVDRCLAIFNYSFPEALQKFEKIHCRLEALTDFPSLLQTARESRIIGKEEADLLKTFSADPRNWKPVNSRKNE